MKIKFGSSRCVLLIGRYAIKIPFNLIGYEQGKNELKLYKKYKHPQLCKIYYSFGSINIMEKCYDIDDYNNVFDEAVYQIKKEIKELDFELCDLWNKDNWGIINNQYKLVDYGITPTIRDKYL